MKNIGKNNVETYVLMLLSCKILYNRQVIHIICIDNYQRYSTVIPHNIMLHHYTVCITRLVRYDILIVFAIIIYVELYLLQYLQGCILLYHYIIPYFDMTPLFIRDPFYYTYSDLTHPIELMLGLFES